MSASPRLFNRLSPTLRGPAWMILAGLAFAGAWAMVRAASHELHPFAIVFYRNLIGALVMLPVAAPVWDRGALRRWPAHLRRASSGIVATYAIFYALAHAPLANVQAINFAAPLFATIGAALFLGEKIHTRRIGALAVGFAGVLIVLRPGYAPLTPGIAAAIAGAAATAFSFIAIKQLVGTDEPRLVAAFTFFLMLPISALLMPFYGAWPSPGTWLALVGLAVSAAFGQLATTYAFRAADATAVMPYDFLRFGVITLIGWWAFGERVDAATLVGGAIILSSSIYLAYREQVASRRAAAPPPVT